MAFRLSGISHWVMWEMATLFEHIGTVQDGIGTLAKRRSVVDRPDAVPLKVTRGEVRFENVTFSHRGEETPSLREASFSAIPGQCVGIIGSTGSGSAQCTVMSPS